jgi:hypothetical protein
MEHIRIYLLLNHYKQKLQLTEGAIALSLSQTLGKEVTLKDLELFNTSNQPHKKALAKAYKDDGYKPKDIAEMIGATIYDTRYYLSNPSKVPYVNMYWNKYVSMAPHLANVQNCSSTTNTGLIWDTDN